MTDELRDKLATESAEIECLGIDERFPIAHRNAFKKGWDAALSSDRAGVREFPEAEALIAYGLVKPHTYKNYQTAFIKGARWAWSRAKGEK